MQTSIELCGNITINLQHYIDRATIACTPGGGFQIIEKLPNTAELTKPILAALNEIAPHFDWVDVNIYTQSNLSNSQPEKVFEYKRSLIAKRKG